MEAQSLGNKLLTWAEPHDREMYELIDPYELVGVIYHYVALVRGDGFTVIAAVDSTGFPDGVVIATVMSLDDTFTEIMAQLGYTDIYDEDLP